MNKLKVGILYGGRSVEHQVSINSARNVYEYLDRNAYEPYLIAVSKLGRWYLSPSIDEPIESGDPLSIVLDPDNSAFIQEKSQQKLNIDVIFPVLHGTDGEDGSIQGLLKSLDIPCVGTGVLGSAVSMDKLTTKQLLSSAAIPTSKFVSFKKTEQSHIKFEEIEAQLGLPFMAKAGGLGSSVGISKVTNKEKFEAAVSDCFKYDDLIIFEEYIKGRELECAIIGNDTPEASMPGEIVISDKYDFYTFDAKYVDKCAVQIVVPAQLDAEAQQTIRALAVRSYQVLRCEDYARVDLFLTDEGEVFINEINTLPGFTNSSMFPMMWAERGIAFTPLISKLINAALERFKRQNEKSTRFESALDS
ncbi:MAG: D-alanine--D-alanine ligase family protein [Bacteroidota bacterium]